MIEEQVFPDWLKEHFEPEPQKKKTRAEKRAEHDRDIMRAFCNFIGARTAEYQSYIRDGGNDVGYLGSHAKKACIPRDLAWECSKPFIKNRFALDDAEEVKPVFDFFYDLATENINWRRKHFKMKK